MTCGSCGGNADLLGTNQDLAWCSECGAYNRLGIVGFDDFTVSDEPLIPTLDDEEELP